MNVSSIHPTIDWGDGGGSKKLESKGKGQMSGTERGMWSRDKKKKEEEEIEER